MSALTNFRVRLFDVIVGILSFIWSVVILVLFFRRILTGKLYLILQSIRAALLLVSLILSCIPRSTNSTVYQSVKGTAIFAFIML